MLYRINTQAGGTQAEETHQAKDNVAESVKQ